MRIVFFGTSGFAIPSLKQLLVSDHTVTAVVTQPDRPKGRSLKVGPSDIKALAVHHELPVYQPNNLEDPLFLDQIRGREAVCAIVISYGKFLPVQLRKLFPFGAFNLHASLLPKYRGAAPIQWTLLMGEKETGVTIFQIDEKMDHGPVLLQKQHPIDPQDNAATLSEALARLGAHAVEEALELLESGKIKLTPQEHSRATSASILQKGDGIIHWKEHCEAISAKVKAFQPWPGAKTDWNGQLLKLLESHPDPKRSSSHSPGMVVTADTHEGIWVQTGQGQLRIDRCQLAGGKPLSAVEFLNGHPLKTGDLLG